MLMCKATHAFHSRTPTLFFLTSVWRKGAQGYGAQASFKLSSVPLFLSMFQAPERPCHIPSGTCMRCPLSFPLLLPSVPSSFISAHPQRLQQAPKTSGFPLATSLTLGTSSKAVVGFHVSLVKTTWLVEGQRERCPKRHTVKLVTCPGEGPSRNKSAGVIQGWLRAWVLESDSPISKSISVIHQVLDLGQVT